MYVAFLDGYKFIMMTVIKKTIDFTVRRLIRSVYGSRCVYEEITKWENYYLRISAFEFDKCHTVSTILAFVGGSTEK